MKAYPFMWAKNRHIAEWCCVAKPRFLEQAKKSILLEAQTGMELAANEIRLVRGFDPSLGTLDIAYRRVESGLKDSAGRNFSFIEGVVLRERDPSLAFCSKQFDAARAKIQPLYERFRDARTWWDEEHLHDAVIDLRTMPGEPVLKVQEVVSKRMPPPAEASQGAAANLGPSGASVRKGYSRAAKELWNKPGAKVAIVGGVVAAAVIGAFVIAEHRRRATRRQQETHLLQ